MIASNSTPAVLNYNYVCAIFVRYLRLSKNEAEQAVNGTVQASQANASRCFVHTAPHVLAYR
jgi:phosphomannomutase